jgi:tetratricopeptide (TPR) repeat protein
MPRPIPPPLSLALTVLRASRGWSQKDLAQAAGLPGGFISDYEMGRRTLTRPRLEALGAHLGFAPEEIEVTLFCTRFLQPVAEPLGRPLSLGRTEHQGIERAAALVSRLAADVTREQLSRSLLEEGIRGDRARAESLWERLKPYPARSRRLLVEEGRDFQTWALCEHLCAESERAGAVDANRALELADLALKVATRVPGPEGWRSRLQGYSWAFLGNARRVASDLPDAETAFVRAWGLWRGVPAVEEGPLAEWRLLDLESSLRRDQRRLPEALELLDRALAAQTGEAEARLLLKKAFTLEQMGDSELAIATLKQATSAVEERGEPRLSCVLRFNLAVNLCHLGRYEQAAALLPEVRQLALRLGNELDLVRTLWLEGRVAAGLGRREEALSALSRVRSEFISRSLGYDVALVSLELAVLYLEDGRTREVMEIAHQMETAFRSQGVHREAIAALRLFQEAANRETATVELARRLVKYLLRARYEPGLSFEG